MTSLTAQNERAVRAFLDGMIEGDLAAVEAAFDPKVRLVLPRPTMSGTTIDGARNLAEFVVNLAREAYVDPKTTYGAVIVDERHAMAEIRLTAKLRATGGDYDQFYCWVFDLKDGRISEIREYIDTKYGQEVNSGPGLKAIDKHTHA